MASSVVTAFLLSAFTQAAPPDSLARLLDQAEKIRSGDKTKSRALLDRVEQALKTTPDPVLEARSQLLECTWADAPQQAYPAAERGLAAAARAGNHGLTVRLMACRATAFVANGRSQEAEREFLQAAGLARQSGLPALQAESLASAAYLRYTRGAMADALSDLQVAYRIDEQLGLEKQRLDTLGLMANVYADSKVAQYDKAIEYYQQLADSYRKRGQLSDLADTLFNLGSTHESKKEYVAAQTYYRQALQLFEQLHKPSDAAYTRRSIGVTMVKEGRPAAALPLFDRALASFQHDGNEESVAMVHQSRGIAYRHLNRPVEAIRDLQAAELYYTREKNDRFLERNFEELALAETQLGDWHKAYDARVRQAELQTRLADSRRDELAARLRVQFDSAKKEQENRALARENLLRADALRVANRVSNLQRVILLLTFLLVLTLAWLLTRQLVNAQRMRVMAMTDDLTRLPNRRNMMAMAEESFLQARKERLPLSVIALDIDSFKRVNDTWGHAAGDLVLQKVAHICRMTLRPGDRIGRMGGEEFLVLLNDTTTAQATEVAERLRAAIERADFPVLQSAVRLTISLGVASLRDEQKFSELADHADELLYRAKEEGRNRVIGSLA